MKKFFLYLIILFLSFFSFNENLSAKSVNVYLFYGKTCPHCEEELDYLNSVKEKYDLNIIKYEVWYDEENKELMHQVASFLDVNAHGVPFTIIDNTPIFGYSKGITDDTFKYHIKLASKNNFVDKVGIKLGLVKGTLSDDKIGDISDDKNLYSLKLPFVKEIDLKNVNLQISTITLGLLDGFNLNNLWIMLFVILLIIGVKDKRKTLILGIIFILCYSLTYFFASGLNLSSVKISNYFTLVRVILCFAGIIMGAIRLNCFANHLDVCKTKDKGKLNLKRIFSKKFLFTLSIVSILLLGVLSVVIHFYAKGDTLALFNSLMILNGLSDLKIIMYRIVYTFMFTIANLILFLIVLFIIKKINFDKKSYANLISGVLLFIISILLLLRPEWLML